MSEPTLQSLASEVKTLSDKVTSLDIALAQVIMTAVDPKELDRRNRDICTKMETLIGKVRTLQKTIDDALAAR